MKKIIILLLFLPLVALGQNGAFIIDKSGIVATEIYTADTIRACIMSMGTTIPISDTSFVYVSGIYYGTLTVSKKGCIDIRWQSENGYLIRRFYIDKLLENKY